MKYIFLCLLLIAPGFATLAIENLGPSCELLLSNPGPTKIGTQSIKLNDDEILVRGKLKAFHEHGMEDTTIYAVFDEYYPRKVVQDYFTALISLKDNDHVYVLNSQNQILVHGYFRDVSAVRSYRIGKEEIFYYPNLPGLYDGPDGSELLRPLDEMARLFAEGLDAVVVRKLEPEERTELQKLYEPLISNYNAHLMDSKRFYQINKDIKIEVAYFENVFDGRFGFKFTQPTQVQGLPSKVTQAMELAVVPQLFDNETNKEVRMGYGDEIFILDENDKLLYRSTIRSIVDYRAVLPARDIVKFVEHIRQGRRIVVIQQKPAS